MYLGQYIRLVFLWALMGLGLITALEGQGDAWLDDQLRIKGGTVSIGAALEQFVEAGISISYRNDQLPEQLISIRGRRMSIRSWLDYLLARTELTYQTVGEERSIVIFPDPEIVNRDFTLHGTIFDANSGERLILANLFVRNRNEGVASNEYGFYALKLPGGRLKFDVSYVGYGQQSFDFVLRSDTTLNIGLSPDLSLRQIIVTANTDSMIGVNPDAGGIRIGMPEVEQLSGPGGENDPLQVISLLPGITTGGDGISGVNIRGSDASQNLILLDGVPVYNLNHAGGLFSIFNSQAIRRVDLYKNGLPARFGGRLAGVLDVHTRDGNLFQNEIRLSQSLLATRLTAEGPLVEGESSYLISGRYFTAGALIPSLSRSYKARRGREGEAAYQLYDLNFKLNQQIDDNDRIYFSFYTGTDDLENAAERRYGIVVLGGAGTVFNYDILNRNAQNISWGNSVGALRWNHNFSERLFTNLSLTYSTLNLRAGFLRQDSIIEETSDVFSGTSSMGVFNSDIRQVGLAFDGQWLPQVGREFRFGGQLNFHRFKPLIIGSNEVEILSENFTFPQAQHLAPTELTGYLAYVIRRPDRQFRIGLRTQYWRTADGGNHLNFSPRLLFTRKVLPWLVLQSTFDVTTQAIHLLGSATIGLPTDIWVPSTREVAPSRAYHFNTAAKFLLGKSWTSEVAVYAKEMENLVEYLNQENLTGNWQDQVSIGRGRSYGMEFSLRKQEGQLRGWLSYTLSRAERTFGPEVNFGNTFPFRNDRLHAISALLSWHPNDRSSLSLSWRFGTGAAYSFSLESYGLSTPSDFMDEGNTPIDFGRNGFRLRPMHRLDINYRFQLPAPKFATFTHTFDLGLYNAYDRHNEIYYELRTEYQSGRSELRADRGFVSIFIAPVLPIFSYQLHFKGKRNVNSNLQFR